MSIALINGRAYINGKLMQKNLLIEDGLIKYIGNEKPKAEKEIDCKRKIVLPGAIDCHVHFRVPGQEYKEDWVSGSLAALHGGVTTVMDMPNNIPIIDTYEKLLKKHQLVSKSALVNFALYMAATENNLQEIELACNDENISLKAVKLYYGKTTGEFFLDDENSIIKIFELSKKHDIVVVAHAEDNKTIMENEKLFAQNNWPEIHSLIRNEEVEAKAISKLLSIQKKIGNKLHFAHVSSKKGLKLIEETKKNKNESRITCEVTPNHLFLDSNKYKILGNLIKCNPSIKGPEHRKALYYGLKKGIVDIIATDHAPHTLEEKNKDYREAPSGIPGVETMVPLILNEVNNKRISLERAIKVICENPAKIFGWKKKGFIAQGFDADLIIVDMKKSFLVENSRLFTKAKYSPFAGNLLKGFIEQTIVRGQTYG
ncbi:MAG: dihydroorotase family protein [Candidatus Diapherotrites archaeon]